MYSAIKHSLPGTVKDVDLGTGTVRAYWSSFENMDSDGERIQRGAYAETISTHGPGSALPRIKVLWQHDFFLPPIGVPLSLQEDDHGLLVDKRITKNTQLGHDILVLYQEEIITEHSVGIDVLERADEDRSIITKVRLWEGSPVTWGANPLTPVVDMKAAPETRIAALDYLDTMCGKMRSALKEPLSDNTAALLEGQLAILQARLGHLKRQTPEAATTEDWGGFLSSVKQTLYPQIS